MPDPMIAYCGPAPVPTDIWTRWNLDPLLMATLAALALVVARGRSSDARAGWAAILAPATPSGAALIALVATIGQMGLLGALIVFAPGPLYSVHLLSTAPWGLSPLADQQLGGLLMWVPASLPYLGVGLWLAWSS